VQSNGDFVVTWASDTQDGAAHGIFAQRFASDGSPAGVEFAVNSYTGGNEFYPSIAALSNDGFVVTWQGSHDGDASGVFARRFSSTGAAVGTEFQVNTYTSADQILPALTGGIAGDFTVVWASGSGFVGSDNDVFAQRYASDGSPLGAEFLVNAFTPGSQRVADIDVHPNGDFVIVYDAGSFMGGYDQDGSYQGIFGRQFASSGTPVGAEFQVNTYTTGFQLVPSVASQGNGAFVVVWNSNLQDAEGVGVFAQQFAQATPTPTPVGAVCGTTPLSGCATPLKASLKIKGGDPAKHRLIWKWLKGTATKSELGNPATGSTEYRLCVYDDGALVMSPGVDADGNWSELTKGFKYSNTVGNADGLTKAVLKEGTGTAKLLFKGKGAALPAPLPLAQSTAVTVQLVKNLGSGSECWESVFTPAAIKSDATQFKDKLP